MKKNLYIVKNIFGLSLSLALWEIMARLNYIDVTFFPAPSLIAMNIIKTQSNLNLFREAFFSLGRLTIAFLISLPLAIGTSYLSIKSKTFSTLISPLIAFTYPLPKIALFPLLMLIFGIDDTSKISLIVLGIFYILFIHIKNSFTKLENPSNALIQNSFPFSRKNYFVHFLLRGSILDILIASKLAINYGLTLAIVSELTASKNGIGFFIWKSWDQFNIVNVYSGILLLGCIGFIIYYFFEHLIQRYTQRIS